MREGRDVQLVGICVYIGVYWCCYCVARRADQEVLSKEQYVASDITPSEGTLAALYEEISHHPHALFGIDLVGVGDRVIPYANALVTAPARAVPLTALALTRVVAGEGTGLLAKHKAKAHGLARIFQFPLRV